MKPTIGWIGLGNMGKPMAQNLVNAGYQLWVHNRTAEKANFLVEQGAQYAETSKVVAEKSDIIITILSNASALQDFYHGDAGLLSGVDSSKIVIDMSTIGHEAALNLAGQLSSKQVRFVDAPVSGSVKPAEAGQLVILAGGETGVVNICRPIFDVLGKETLHFGKNGSGSQAKLVVNLLLGITMQGIAESLILAEKMGLDRELVIKMMTESAVNKPMLGAKTNALMDESFPPAFALKWMEKDLNLAMETAKALESSLPLAANAAATYTSAIARGKGDLDVAAIFLHIKELSEK